MKINRVRLFKLIVYFRRGFAIYISFPLNIINFTIITYTLAISKIEFLNKIFMDSPYIYAAVVLLVIAPLATILGRLDYKKMTVPREFESNPYFRLPNAKEREIYAPFFLTVLDSLEKLLEKNGIENHEIIKLKKKINEWRKKQV